jgi:HK97 family phage major capsid protein
MPDLNTLTETFQRVETEFKATLEKQSAEISKHGETSAATAKAVEEATSRLSDLGKEIVATQAKITELENEVARGGGQAGEAPKSIGEQFTASEQYGAMKKARATRSERFDVPNLFAPQATLLTSGTTSAGDLIVPQRYTQVIAPNDRQLRLRDLLGSGTTETNAIQYVEETGFTNAAAGVVEGTGAKPESALVFDIRTAPVETIAHWIPATRQVLDDIGQLKSYIDGRLLFGLKLKEEQQILYGTGTSPQLQGIMTHADVQTYAWSSGTVGDTKVDAIRRAMTLAQIAEYPVDTVVLHPTDWEDIELTKGSDGHYLWVSVPSGGEMRIWRLNVVVTTAMTAGEFMVGAARYGAMLWDRMQASIFVTDSHADYFIYNKLVILAEERLALTIFRPEAFVAGEFDAAPAEASS